MRFDDAGDEWQAELDGGSFDYPRGCFVVGRIDDRGVPCLSIDQQLQFCRAYEFRDVDRHDVALLEALKGQRP